VYVDGKEQFSPSIAVKLDKPGSVEAGAENGNPVFKMEALVTRAEPPKAPAPPSPPRPASPPTPPTSAANADATLKNASPSRYPADAAKHGVSGKVDLVVNVAADGSVTNATIKNSQPAGIFDATALEAVKKWKFNPATKNGKPVAGQVLVPITFSLGDQKTGGRINFETEKTAASMPPSGSSTASVNIESKNLNPPRYPVDAAKQGISGKVVLIVDVAADGSASNVTVEKSEPQGMFDDASLEAAKKWKFNPGMKDGKPVAGRVRVPITFEIPNPDTTGMSTPPLSSPATDVPPPPPSSVANRDVSIKNMYPPRYPANAAKQGISGIVIVNVDVAADGSVSDATIEKSPPGAGHLLNASALETAKKWTFNPAIKDGEPVASRLRIPIGFWLGKPTDEQMRKSIQIAMQQ
jgi:TonB family protein